MLNRRHIRVKVMQVLYALTQTGQPDLLKEEKFLRQSIAQSRDLYLILIDLLIEVRAAAEDFLEKGQQKMLATAEDIDPNRRFIENQLLIKLADNETLQKEMHSRKLHNWRQSDEYIHIIFKELRNSDLYREYMERESTTFKQDREFVIQFFSEVVAPNEKLYDYLEDFKLTWPDDLPLVNTTIVKRLQKMKPNSPETTILVKLYKDEEDEQFAKSLLLKTAQNDEKLENEILGNTPNWDQDRIATMDKIILKMAIGELLYFSSIPVKVTINEYLELAKEYSTPKSSLFINGILDRLSKKYKEENRLNKIGRGLIE
ncbi:MAG: transcription antitermination factor NusB [Leeuwenhoekiella sp.]